MQKAKYEGIRLVKFTYVQMHQITCDVELFNLKILILSFYLIDNNLSRLETRFPVLVEQNGNVGFSGGGIMGN